MTKGEMTAFAQALLDGGKYTRPELLKFMKAFTDPDLQAVAPEVTLPELAFEIEKTETGIHVPREANRSYTQREGLALLEALTKALQ